MSKNSISRNTVEQMPTHRLVPIANLTALFALLPPKPQTINGTLYEYQDPDAVERLHEIRSVFETLMSVSPLHQPKTFAVSAPSGDVRGRCEICDWPLADSPENGCVPGDCSYRPSDPTEQQRIRERRATLSAEGAKQ